MRLLKDIREMKEVMGETVEEWMDRGWLARIMNYEL